VHLPWIEALGIAVGAIGTALIAGCGPALHAVRVRIPEAISYE
jgi:ABC-type lipoprotein release transport system permease subunit